MKPTPAQMALTRAKNLGPERSGLALEGQINPKDPFIDEMVALLARGEPVHISVLGKHVFTINPDGSIVDVRDQKP